MSANELDAGQGQSVGRSDQEDCDDQAVVVPLTALQAKALREKHPQMSPWQVLAVQALAGALVALVVGFVGGKASLGLSAGYGALVVLIPGVVFARGLTSRLTSVNAGTAMVGFFFWEAVKIALAVAMLFAASKAVTDLSWPALLIGLVVTMKAIWVSLLMRPKSSVKRQVE